MKILVADDDPQLVRALRITLAAHGYDVVAAPDGAAAIALAAQAHPDLVLLDLGMPQLDGMQVIEALRGWTTAPIIVVSGRTGSADKVEALDAGADDYVTKPFQIDELLARLRALSRRTHRRERRPGRLVRGCRRSTSPRSPCHAAARGCTSRPPNGGCWSSSPAIPARSSPGRRCSRRSGRARASPTPATCGSTCRSCARSSRPTRRTPSTCSPSPGMGYRLVLDGATDSTAA